MKKLTAFDSKPERQRKIVRAKFLKEPRPIITIKSAEKPEILIVRPPDPPNHLLSRVLSWLRWAGSRIVSFIRGKVGI